MYVCTAGEAKSAAYDCLVPYDDRRMDLKPV